MKDRIKAVRKSVNMNQTDFGKAVGVTLSAEQKWELGISVPSDAAIMNIVSKFGYREEWLRTGEGPEKNDDGITREMTELVSRLFTERPETFKAKLLTVLLRFDPNSDQWKMLEDIFRLVAAEMPAAPVPDPNAPADLDSKPALHAELERLAALEKGDTAKSEASLSIG